jgi:hypothetical protein
MAATIISSTFTIGIPQIDGRVFVTEVHTWDSGLPVTILEYGPVPATLDFQSIANARALVIMQSKRDEEAQDNINLDRYLLVYNTETQMLTYLHELYIYSVGMETCRLARWIIDRLDQSAFSITAIRTVWGLSVPQWNSFNGVLDTYAASYTSVNAARGIVVS